MVYLNRIYTKSGDTGETGLGDGTRVAKDSTRVEAIGAVDELNANLGLLLAHVRDYPEAGLIRGIQNDLFDVGADLCMPATKMEEPGKCLRVTPIQVGRLEKAIDRVNAKLAPLHSFVLPGGSVAAAWCHSARTVCRRAERSIVTLMNEVDINQEALKYLNRLSDLLFVLARAANDNGANDILWKPGGERNPE
jgi:cob(I)alamin adenosyltransferase